MSILAIGLLFLSKIGAETPYLWIAFSLVLTGSGTGIFISPNTSAIMGAAPPKRRGIASGIMATSRSVGMVLGIGIAGAIFTTVLAHKPVEIGGNEFFLAIQISFLVTSGIATLGVITSAIRKQNLEE
jgi:MFS family permease